MNAMAVKAAMTVKIARIRNSLFSSIGRLINLIILIPFERTLKHLFLWHKKQMDFMRTTYLIYGRIASQGNTTRMAMQMRLGMLKSEPTHPQLDDIRGRIGFSHAQTFIAYIDFVIRVFNNGDHAVFIPMRNWYNRRQRFD
jgi:hypothetical protein